MTFQADWQRRRGARLGAVGTYSGADEDATFDADDELVFIATWGSGSRMISWHLREHRRWVRCM